MTKFRGTLIVANARGCGYTDAATGRIRGALRSSLQGRNSGMVTAQGKKKGE